MENHQNNSLRSNVIGLLGAVTLGVVMLSPAMTLYGGFGPSFLNAGTAAPLAFVWALLATIPTAISYALLSREHPLSGSASSWVALMGSRKLAVWAGWMIFLYYATNFVIQPVTLGVFFGDLTSLIGMPRGTLSFTLGVLICCAWPASIAYRGISLSAKGALGFLLFESAVVFALCATIIFSHGASSGAAALSLEGFKISSSTTGMSGIFRAMVFAMLAYCGFDVVSTLAEETKMAKKLIPQATLLALVIYAGFIIAGIWCLTYGGSFESLKQVAESGQMPITEIAKKFWGAGGILITLTAISASLGLAIATAVGASRILFSMGRDGLAPRKLAELHPVHKVPHSAMHVIFGGGLIAALAAGAWIGPYNAYVWWGTTSTFFAMITYLLVNTANIWINRPKLFSSLGAFLGFGLIPLLGIAVDGFILVRCFFIELWQQGWATGQSVVVFDVGCALIALFIALRKPRGEKASLEIRVAAPSGGVA